jgi:hypothetical protein
VAIAAPRNGTTSHTVTPSSGTAVGGTLFTPTAGNLLVCLVEGAVTSTTPSDWTLPSGGSAVDASGFYVWHRVAAGSDSLTTTHNGSNYPVLFHFIEFAAGSTFGTAASAIQVLPTGGAGPSLTGLTGTPWVAAAMAQDLGGSGPHSVTWSAGTELVDTYAAVSGTDGYVYSLTHVADYGSSTWSAAATSNYTGAYEERLVFSVAVATVGAPTGRPKVYVGGSFQTKPGKIWTGSAWVEKPWKRWTGTEWKTLP